MEAIIAFLLVLLIVISLTNLILTVVNSYGSSARICKIINQCLGEDDMDLADKVNKLLEDLAALTTVVGGVATSVTSVEGKVDGVAASVAVVDGKVDAVAAAVAGLAAPDFTPVLTAVDGAKDEVVAAIGTAQSEGVALLTANHTESVTLLNRIVDDIESDPVPPTA